MRGGDNKFDRRNIVAAIDDSLQRLRTDYIDLYQLHWPERTVNAFGRLMYQHHPEQTFTPFAEVLGVLGEAVKAGKIRHVGLSNETAWGTMRWLAAAEQGAGPRMVSIQNCYHLMNRMFEVGLAEVAIREQIGLLAFSPLAMGTLSGKYLGGARPARRAHDGVPQLPALHGPARPGGDRGLCRPGAQARAGPGADGAGLDQRPGLHHRQHHRRHHPRCS